MYIQGHLPTLPDNWGHHDKQYTFAIVYLTPEKSVMSENWGVEKASGCVPLKFVLMEKNEDPWPIQVTTRGIFILAEL